MSKFYSNYCKKHNINKPRWIVEEECIAEYKNKLIEKCKRGWNYSKHIGSKPFNQILLGSKY